MKNVGEFNIVTIGVGGQGVLTLAGIISEAALKQKYDVKMSELHGLSQRGGSIPCQVRFGKKIYSSLVKTGDADLVIAMEPLEAMRAARYASPKKTVLFMNTHKVKPVSVTVMGEKYPSMSNIRKELEKFYKEIIMVDATEISKKYAGSSVMSNIYMLGLISAKRAIPIKKENLLDAVLENVPTKYRDMNKDMFNLGEHPFLGMPVDK